MNEQQAVEDALTSAVPASFLESLTRQLEKGANIKAVFGEPIERNGTTVIPVARARWGAGEAKARMGGGAVISPVGFIEVSEGCATFKAIASPAVTLAAVIGGAVISLGLIKAFSAPRKPHRFFERRRTHR